LEYRPISNLIEIGSVKNDKFSGHYPLSCFQLEARRFKDWGVSVLR